MIRSKGFPLSLSAAHLWRDDAPLKSHYAYQKAKAGDKDAALELVVDLAVTWVSGLRERLKPAFLPMRRRQLAITRFRKRWRLCVRRFWKAMSIQGSCNPIVSITRGLILWSGWQRERSSSAR